MSMNEEKEEPLLGDILNSLLNDNIDELNQQTLGTRISHTHHHHHQYKHIGAGIWDTIKSYVRYTQDTGVEWIAKVIDLLHRALETVGQWLMGLNESAFVNITMQIWRDLAEFASELVTATVDRVSYLLETFKRVFKRLFLKSLGLFASATETIIRWSQQLVSLANVKVTRAAALLLEPFKILGTYLSSMWIPTLLSKQNTVLDTTCVGFVTSVCSVATRMLNIKAYFGLISAFELYGKSIALSHTLGIYQREHVDSDRHHRKFVRDVMKVGKYALDLIPGMHIDLSLPASLILQLQANWRNYLKKPDLKLSSERDAYYYSVMVLKKYTLGDPNLLGEIARSVFESKVLRDTVAQMSQLMHTKYCPVESDNLPIGDKVVSQKSLERVIERYKRQPSKDPKVARTLDTFLLVNKTEHGIGASMDDAERADLLEYILNLSDSLLHAMLEHKEKQSQRDRRLSTLQTDEERMSAVPLDSSAVISAALKLISAQQTLTQMGFTTDDKDSNFVHHLISQSLQTPMGDGIPSSSSSSSSSSSMRPESGILGDITHWRSLGLKERNNIVHFQNYLQMASDRIAEGKPVLDFCGKPGNTLEPSTVERFGKHDDGQYIFFIFYEKISRTVDGAKQQEIITLYDDLNAAVVKYDVLRQYLAWDNIAYYAAWPVAFAIVGLEVAVGMTGMLKPTNPHITSNALQDKKKYIDDAETALAGIDALMARPASTLNEWERSLVKHFKEVRVSVNDTEGGYEHLKGIVSALSRFANAKDAQLEQPLMRSQYEWTARVAFEYLNKVIDNALEDTTAMFVGVYKSPHAFKTAYVFSDNNSNVLSLTDNLTNFTSSVLHPLFPTIQVFNANIKDREDVGFFKRLAGHHKQVTQAIFEEKTRPIEEITAADVPVKEQLNFYNSAAMTQLSNKIVLFDEASQNINMLLNTHNTIATCNSVISLQGDLMHTNATTVGEFLDASLRGRSIKEYLHGFLSVEGAVMGVDKSYDSYTQLPPKEFVRLYGSAMSELSLKLAKTVTTLRLSIGEGDPEVYDIDKGRVDELLDKIAAYFSDFENESIYKSYAMSSMKTIPRSSAKYAAYKKEAATLAAVIELEEKSLAVFANPEYAKSRVGGMLAKKEAIDELARLTDPNYTDSMEYISLKRQAQPYLAHLHMLSDESSAPVRRLISKFNPVMNDPNSDPAVKLSIARKFLSMLDEEHNRVLRTSFIQSLSESHSQERGVDVTRGLSVLNEIIKDFFYKNNDRTFSEIVREVIEMAPEASPLKPYDTQSVLHMTTESMIVVKSEQALKKIYNDPARSDLQEIVVKSEQNAGESSSAPTRSDFQTTIVENEQVVRENPVNPLRSDLSYISEAQASTSGNTEAVVKATLAAVGRSDEMKQLLLGTTLQQARTENPYATDEELFKITQEKRAAIWEDYTMEDPKVYRSDFNVPKYLHDNVSTIRANQNILSGTAFNIPFNPSESLVTTRQDIWEAIAVGTTAQDAPHANLAAEDYVSAEFDRLCSSSLSVLFRHGKKEAVELELALIETRTEADQVISFQRKNIYGTLEESKEQFAKVEASPTYNVASQFLAFRENSSASDRAHLYNYMHGAQITDPALAEAVTSLKNMNTVETELSVVGASKIFAGKLTENLHALFKTVSDKQQVNQKAWLEHMKHDLKYQDIGYAEFYSFFKSSLVEHQQDLANTTQTITGDVAREIYTDHANSIFFQKLSLKLLELLNGRESNPFKSNVVTTVLSELQDSFNALAVKMRHKYASTAYSYGIGDAGGVEGIHSLSVYSPEMLRAMEAYRPSLVERLVAFSKEWFSGFTYASTWVSSFFTSKDYNAMKVLSYVGRNSVQLFQSTMFVYSVFNNSMFLAGELYNISGLINTTSFIAPVITSGVDVQGILEAIPVGDAIRVSSSNVSPRLVTDALSDFAILNTEQPRLSHGTVSVMTKARNIAKRAYTYLVNLTTKDGLCSLVYNLCAGVVGYTYTYRLVKQLMQLLYHWYDDSVFFAFDVDLPTAAMGLCATGSLLMILADRGLIALMKEWNFNRNNIFHSFPSIKGHHLPIDTARSAVTVINFFKAIFGAFQSIPEFNAPAVEAAAMSNVTSSSFSHLIPDVSFLLNVGFAAQGVGVGMTAYSFFRPGGFDLVDAVVMFKEVLRKEYHKYEYSLAKNITPTYLKINSSNVNEILSVDGIFWISDDLYASMNRDEIIKQYLPSVTSPFSTNTKIIDFSRLIIDAILKEDGGSRITERDQLISSKNGGAIVHALNSTEDNTQLVDFVRIFIQRRANRRIITSPLY